MTPNVDPFGWVGETIGGKYRVDAFIEEGGFGAVYKGYHLTLHKPIAIKCIKFASGLDHAQQTRLERNLLLEAQVLSDLSSKTAGIVQVHDIGAATSPRGQWSPYIVMEWLPGRTLKAEIEERRKQGRAPRGIEEAIQLLTPAAEALAVAHRNNVSHRDIKPGNLFLIESSPGVRMKVLDFGIAKIISQAPSTWTTLNAFTAPYGAPEQFSDAHGPTGLATDVFAMALTVLEVASGRCVIQGKGFMELYESARDAHRRQGLFKNVVDESSTVARVIRRALEPNPAGRHPDLVDFWDDLKFAIGRIGESSRMPPSVSFGTKGAQRVCTVMLVHLTNIEALHSTLEFDVALDVMDRCMAAVTDQAKRLGAVVHRSETGRAFVTFGAFSPMDQHHERAVVAALRGIEALGRAASSLGSRAQAPSATIAIDTGRVFVPSDRPTVIGEPVIVAEHLLRAARPGVIVIGRDTHQMIASHFNVEPLPPLRRPNQDEPLLWYRVKDMVPVGAALVAPDFHGVKTKLVGREIEQHRIRAALESMLSAGRAQLVTLIGPPGVGRSRLLADFFAHLTMRKGYVLALTGRCSPLFADMSYSLAATLLRQRFGLDARDLPRQIDRKLRAGVRWFHARWMRGKPFAADDMILPPPVFEEPVDMAALDEALQHSAWILGRAETEVHVDPGSLDDSRTQMKQRTTDAVLRLARFFTRRAPIVILCDDLHWADDASLDLLEALVRQGERLPVMLVCSARPELLDRRPDWGRSAERNHLVEIEPLSSRAMDELIRDMLRQMRDLPEEVIGSLASRAEGNPLILKETLDFLVDTGVIEVRAEQPWVLHRRPGALRLPATVQQMVQARLDRLEPEAREVLVLAAVVGRSFLHGAVDHLRRAAPAGVRIRSTEEILLQLRERRLISAVRTISGEPESMFMESAMYEVAYQMLLATDRRAQHRLVAEWLEARSPLPGVTARLAYHYDQAGDAKNAAAAYVRAAAHATSLGDTTAALRHLDRARMIHDEARGQGSRQGGEERRIAAFPDRVLLRLDLGDALRRAGRIDEAERSYAEARELLLWAERRAGVVIHRAEALRWEAYIDARVALLHLLRGELAEARELLERAIVHATEVGAGADLAEMYRNLAEAELGCGQLGAAIEAGERALVIAEDHGRAFLGDVALTLARVLTRAWLADPGLRPRVKVGATALDGSLAKHFEADDLRPRAEECRVTLGPVLRALRT